MNYEYICIMLRAYKYRLYPTAEQAEFFAKSIGCCRFVYNRSLDYLSMFWLGEQRSVSYYDAKRQLVELKQIYPWLDEVNSQSLQYAVKQCADGFRNWWQHRARHPLPKRKHARNTFHNPQHCSIDWKRSLLDIPKCKGIRIRLHRSFYGTIKDVTVSLDADGRYYASVLVETAQQPAVKRAVDTKTTVGLDTGVHTFVVCSDGRKFVSGHFAASEAKRLKHYQRMLRHMEKGSLNWKRTQKRIACIHSKVSNRRLDYLHKVTYALTHDSQVGTLCIEDLDVREWMRHRQLAYDTADVSVGRFYDLLRYKCEWYGVNLVMVNRWASTSKTCSVCGAVNRCLKLSQRSWVCGCCGTRHDRDYNASLNIKSFGLGALPSGGGEVTPADCRAVDDRRASGLRSSGRERQEKFRSATDAPVL